jgi:hypothetical protein
MISASVQNSEPALNLLLQRGADVNIKSKSLPQLGYLSLGYLMLMYLTRSLDNNGQVSSEYHCILK